MLFRIFRACAILDLISIFGSHCWLTSISKYFIDDNCVMFSLLITRVTGLGDFENTSSLVLDIFRTSWNDPQEYLQGVGHQTDHAVLVTL